MQHNKAQKHFNKVWVEEEHTASRASLAFCRLELSVVGRNPVYLGSESVLAIIEACGVRVHHGVLGNRVGGVRKDKNVFLKAQRWVQVLFITCFQNNML